MFNNFAWLFGKTGYSFFEYWSLGHFAFWFWFGTITAGLKLPRLTVFLVSVGLAFLWEIIETFGEKMFPKLAIHPESWWNRWLSDPLMCVLGLLIAWYGFEHWRSQ
jgi:hypothetical protein